MYIYIIEIYRTAFFTVHHDVEKTQNMNRNRQTHKACIGSHIARIIGLKLCGEIQFPNLSLETSGPYFPLTGPIILDISLINEDVKESYNIEVQFSKVIKFVFHLYVYISHKFSKCFANFYMYVNVFHNLQTTKDVNIIFAFNTPGSQTNRALSAKFLLDIIGSKIKLGLQSPRNRAVFTGV